MIIAKRKPLDQIMEMLAPYNQICVLGCGACVTVCMAGGQKEAEELAALIRIHRKKENRNGRVESFTVERQCEYEYIDQVLERLKGFDIILTLACGVGPQTLVEHAADLLVLPGVNTTSMGYPKEQGVWVERCLGCGDCILHLTQGICPITRCAKSILNGPCGGSAEGKCELGQDIECAWHLIHDRLSALGCLDNLSEIQPLKNWSVSHHGGPRTTVREDVRVERGE
ncbi:MAG: methylenetetrahydrofolate reductase C-terminal domain-containing protein [Dethiobacter sp.]|jgi:ferredoxin|nr:methylenetetrahydrofolate reductase C-terminal domain-containing protein [Dethiobacter sp.]